MIGNRINMKGRLGGSVDTGSNGLSVREDDRYYRVKRKLHSPTIFFVMPYNILSMIKAGIRK